MLHYAIGMTRHALYMLFLLPGLAHAVICKTVDADGVVGYTDVPVSECADPVKLPDYSRYEPRPIPKTATTSPKSSGNGKSRDGQFSGYRSIEISQPEATVRCMDDGQVKLIGAAMDAYQPILLPRKWDDPERESDEDPEEELTAFAGRVREAMEQWAEAVKVLRIVDVSVS